MKKYLLNFATKTKDSEFLNFEYLQKMQNAIATRYDFDEIVSWNREKLLGTDFYLKYKKVLDRIRGAGYWLWKPYIIYDLMHKVNFGDIVFYLDTDIVFVDDPQPLYDICLKNHGFFLVEERKPNLLLHQWTKRDTFHFMNADTKFFHDQNMCEAGIQIYQKNDFTMKFVKDYLYYSTINDNILTDDPNICGKPNLTGFIEHRHDQSVLSILIKKYNIETFRLPTQHGNQFKEERFRRKGEYLETPYQENVYRNSPYGTILRTYIFPGGYKRIIFWMKFVSLATVKIGFNYFWQKLLVMMKLKSI